MPCNVMECNVYVFMHVCFALGCPGIMEHLATASLQPEAASTWLLPMCTSLLASGAKLHVIDQRSVGARSLKPTGLLAVSFPRIAESVDLHTKCICLRNHSHVTAAGKDENGKYKTTPIKQYP